jgi:hypothetical protein
MLRRFFAFVPLAMLIALPACGAREEAARPRQAESAASRPAGPEAVRAPLQPTDDRTLYRLRGVLDPRLHTVQGQGEILWTNSSSRDVDQIFLYLHLNAFRDRRTTFLVESRGQLRGEPYRGPGHIELNRLAIAGQEVLDRAQASETWLRVPLDRPVPPGGSLRIESTWIATLPPIFARVGWQGGFHLVAQWFPKLPVLSPDGSWMLRERHANAEFYADHAD